MTHKDKAIELHEDYWSVYYADLADEFTCKYIHDISKECALICINKQMALIEDMIQIDWKIREIFFLELEQIKIELEKL